MAKKQKKVPVQKRTGRVALISLFCAAAGVYAADTTDGWSYNAETATIEHNGESTFPRTIKKGNQFEDGSEIGSVSNVKVSGSATMGRDGVVFDGGEAKTGTLTMEEGAVLDSNRGQGFVGGKPEGITTVKFEDGVKGKIDAAGATISAESYKDATAVSGEEIESITAKEISAKTVDVDNRNATAIDADTIGSVNVDKIVGDIKVGQIKDIKIGELKGGWLDADVLGDSDSKDAKVDIGANDAAISARTIKSEATITGIDDGSPTRGGYGVYVDVDNAEKKLTLKGKLRADVINASEGIVVEDVKGLVNLGDEQTKLGNTTAKLGENALEVKGTLDGDLNSFGTISGNVEIDTINGNTTISALDGDLTAKTLGKSELEEGENPSETNITVSASDKGNRTIGIDTINGNATISMDDTDGSMTIKKIGQVNGELTVNDYAKIENIENVDGKLTLNGGDKQATAKVGYTKELFANADGLIDVDTADTVHLKGEKLSLKGQTVKSESENSRTTIADLGKDETIGSVIVGDVKLDGSIDGFAGNLTANSTDDVNIENGYTGNIDIKEVRDADGNPAGNFRSDENAIAGDVKLGTVGNVEVNGGIAANGEAANGNLAIDNVLGNVDIKKGVAGDVNIGSAGGSMNVDGGIGGNFEIANSEGLVNVDTVGKDMTIGANGSSIKVGKVVGTAKIDGEGTFEIKNAGGLELGNADGKLTITDNNLILSESSNINSILDENGKGTQIDNGGNVKLTTLDKETTIDGFEGNLSAGTTTDINVGDKGLTGNLTVGTVNGKLASSEKSKITGDITLIDANEVALGGDVDGNITVVDKAGKVDVANVSGDLNIATANGDVTANGTIGGDLGVANANGNVLATTVGGDMTVGNLGGGTVSATEVGGTAKITGNGTFDIAKAGNLDLGTTSGSLNLVGNLTAFDEAGENVRLTVNENNNIVIERDVIDPTTGDVRKTQTVTAKVSENGSLTVKDLDAFDNADASFKGDITVKGKANDFTIGSVNNLEFNKGVDGNLTIGTSVKSITAKDADGNLKDISGSLDVAKNTGDITVGNVGGKMTLGKAQGAVVADSANGVDATLNDGSLKINGSAGDVNLKGKGTVENIAESSSLTFTDRFDGKAEFGTISGNVNADGHFVDDLKIGTAAGSVDLADVNKLVIEHATGGENANVTVGQVNESLNVKLENDTNLFVKGNVLGTATVNGGCDATFEQYAENVKVTEQLNGLLDIQNGVNNLEIKNVEQLKVGTVDGLAKFLGDGEITIVENGVVTRFENGLEALDSGKINVENEIVVADNKAIEAAGRVIEANKMISFEGVNAGEDGVVLRAAKLTGTSAKDIVDALYKDAYGIGADGEESLTKYTLVGDHGDIDGKIAADISEIADKSLNDANLAGEYRNGENGKVVFNVSKNSFFENRATSENEKAFAQVLDSAEYTGNDASDERAVAVKRNYYNLAQNGGFASALPQTVSRAARMNMDLANIVHLDTINRTSATRDMINAYGKKLNEFGRTDSLVKGTSFVTVRNINRFASYGGDSYASGSNDYIYGGLVNAEYLVNEDLFAGLGVGGFQAKSSGKDNSGKAETQSFALNLYGDYAFYDGFDWYFGATYAFGMNNTDRQRGAEKATSDWNSNLVGVFSGVRYTWKPFEDQSIAIKPLVGLNANFLLNPSYDEDAGGLDKLSIEERDYSSFKTIVGVEAVKAFDFGLSVAARMFYTHEFADNSYNVGATLGDTYRTYGSFVYRGYEMDRDSGIFGVGLGYDINPDWRVYLDYAAEVSGDVYHNLNAGVQLKF